MRPGAPTGHCAEVQAGAPGREPHQAWPRAPAGHCEVQAGAPARSLRKARVRTPGDRCAEVQVEGPVVRCARCRRGLGWSLRGGWFGLVGGVWRGGVCMAMTARVGPARTAWSAPPRFRHRLCRLGLVSAWTWPFMSMLLAAGSLDRSLDLRRGADSDRRVGRCHRRSRVCKGAASDGDVGSARARRGQRNSACVRDGVVCGSARAR